MPPGKHQRKRIGNGKDSPNGQTCGMVCAMNALAYLIIATSPPPFSPAWVNPADHWDVPAGVGPAVALGAFIGGLVGDVHPAWLVATAAVETGYRFNPRAAGDSGRSLGLCQIQLATARQSIPWATRALLSRPTFNLFAAGVHYGRLIRLYGRALAQARYGCGFRCHGVTRGARAKAAVFKRLVM